MPEIPEIPLVDIGQGGGIALFDAQADRAAALVETTLSSHALLPLAARFADQVSRRWLTRQANPYRNEIEYIAERLSRRGVYFLNIVYEWACSTSAARDPTGSGARLIRVLDWGLTGIGRYVVIARHETTHGPFYNVTWPGFVGVLTAMAPGRFAAAINQAPRMPIIGPRWLDEALGRMRLVRLGGAMPAAHLLRQVCEEAGDYETAVTMLMDRSISLAMPAIFSLSGSEGTQCCVIEAIARDRRLHRGAEIDNFTVGVANDWLSPDLDGAPRPHALEWERVAPRENNQVRRKAVCALQGGAFAGTTDLAPPVLNGHTVLVAAANAATGEMLVEALDPIPGQGPVPQVVARRVVQHQTSNKEALRC
ncbi:MAG TPA: hypothetical protein VGU20_06835 [Stellaceae bacterium]|nr:hypothetical protein [Stellaceae bacterium]